MKKFKTFLIGRTIQKGPVEHSDNAVLLFYPLANVNNLHRVGVIFLLARLLGDLFFDRIRTKDQFGYIVKMATDQVNEQVGLSFLVQSHLPIDLIIDRIDRFIFSEAPSYLMNEVPLDQLDKVVKSLIRNLISMPSSLKIEASKYWAVIRDNTLVKDGFFFESKYALGSYLMIHETKEIPEMLMEVWQELLDESKRVTITIFGEKSFEMNNTTRENFCNVTDEGLICS